MAKIMFKKILVVVTAVATLSAIFEDSVNAATFSFTQDGYPGGGTISGSFVGQDNNNDGRITFQFNDRQPEVTQFSLNWSGNNQVPAGLAGLDNLRLLTLILPTPTQNLFIEVSAFNLSVSVSSTGGTVRSGFPRGETTTCNPPSVRQLNALNNQVSVSQSCPTSIPEPSSVLGLVSFGVLGIGSLILRQQKLQKVYSRDHP